MNRSPWACCPARVGSTAEVREDSSRDRLDLSPVALAGVSSGPTLKSAPNIDGPTNKISVNEFSKIFG